MYTASLWCQYPPFLLIFRDVCTFYRSFSSEAHHTLAVKESRERRPLDFPASDRNSMVRTVQQTRQVVLCADLNRVLLSLELRNLTTLPREAVKGSSAL